MDEICRQVSLERDVYRVSLDNYGVMEPLPPNADPSNAVLHLFLYRQGERASRIIAYSSPHGEWISFLAQ